MASKEEYQDYQRASEEHFTSTEDESLIQNESFASLRLSHSFTTHLAVLYAVIFGLLVILMTLLLYPLGIECHDPSLKIWCMSRSQFFHTALTLAAPANRAVEYRVQTFRGAMFNATEYMGFPTDETDQLWSDLYNCEFFKRAPLTAS
jgi:hypothetical protein